MRCDTCGGSNMTVVSFESASAVTYRYCRECETSAWFTDEGNLEVGTILKAARAIEPAGRRSRALAA